MPRRKTNQEFVEQVIQQVGTEYIPFTKYINKRKKVLMFHVDCCSFYWVSPDAFLNGRRRCPYCFGNKKLTTKEFKERVYSKYGDEYKVVGEYRSASSPIAVKHIVCGSVFYPTPTSLMAGHLCFRCSYVIRGKKKAKTMMHQSKISKGEKLTRHVLDDLGYNYIFAYVLPNKLHLDFYLPELKTGIEYDGIQHYQPRELFGGEEAFKIVKKHDYEKDVYCKDHGIRLIRIPYTVSTYKDIKQLLVSYL